MTKLIQIPSILLIVFLFSQCATTSEMIIISDLHYPADLKVISRSDWGWQPLTQTLPQHKIDKITIHHGGEFLLKIKI